MSGKPEQRSLDEVRRLLRGLEEASASDKRPDNVIVLPSVEAASSAEPTLHAQARGATPAGVEAPSTPSPVRPADPLAEIVPSPTVLASEHVGERKTDGRLAVKMAASFALLVASGIGVWAWHYAPWSVATMSGAARPLLTNAAVGPGQPEQPSERPAQRVPRQDETPAPAGDRGLTDPSPSAGASKPAQEFAQAPPTKDTRLPPEFRPSLGANTPPTPRPAQPAEQARIRLPASVTLVAGQSSPLQISLEGEAPSGSSLLIVFAGSQAFALSKGQELQAGTWRLPIADLASVAVSLRTPGAERTDVTVELRSAAGDAVSSARSTIVVAPATSPATAQSSTPSPSPARPSMADPVRPDEVETARLLMEGKRQWESGQVAPARLLFRRAADAGSAEAARLLGDSFDPAKLYLLGVRGISGDVEKAVYWYERADELGDPHAKARLLSLGGR